MGRKGSHERWTVVILSGLTVRGGSLGYSLSLGYDRTCLRVWRAPLAAVSAGDEIGISPRSSVRIAGLGRMLTVSGVRDLVRICCQECIPRAHSGERCLSIRREAVSGRVLRRCRL